MACDDVAVCHRADTDVFTEGDVVPVRDKADFAVGFLILLAGTLEEDVIEGCLTAKRQVSRVAGVVKTLYRSALIENATGEQDFVVAPVRKRNGAACEVIQVGEVNSTAGCSDAGNCFYKRCNCCITYSKWC